MFESLSFLAEALIGGTAIVFGVVLSVVGLVTVNNIVRNSQSNNAGILERLRGKQD